MCHSVKAVWILSPCSARLKQLNYRGAFLIEMWTEKADEPVAEIVQARRWIEQQMQQGGMTC
ncbi:L-ribulose-5-phosphate 3-epimerase ulaE [Serratia fonticola]|uniref:L-ribulose-5-phosphate 3-epimerase ulaE n=1 Tax=Serratia fonticola TaxID=47917 RepID=A0A4U9U2B7_SERFO|nr:L-ribulose-5-phosphate 3-epimerase ulaE [Serratia fonticola]